MGEVSDVMDEISAKNKQELLELLFGKNRANAGAALLTNYKQVYKVIETINESSGSAEREMNTMSESITFKVNEFKETLTDLGKTIFTQNFLKDIVNTGTSVVDVLDKIIDKIGIIPTILAGISITKAFKNVGVFKIVDDNLTTIFSKTQAISNGFNLASNSVNNFVDGFNRLNSNQNFGSRWTSFLNGATSANANMAMYFQELATKGASARAEIEGVYAAILQGNTKGLSNVKSIISAYKQIGNVSPENQRAFANAVNQTNTSLGSYLLNLNGAKASLAGYTLQVIKTTAKQIALRTATIALNMTMTTLVIGGLNWVISKIDELITTQKEAEEATKDLQNTALSKIDAMKSESAQIDELIKKYTGYVVTTNNLADARDEIISTQSQISDIFGEEKSQIDLLNKSYAENISLINQRRKAETDAFLRDNQQAYNNAKKFLDSESFAQTIYNNDDTYFTKISDDAIKLKALGIGGWSETTKNNWKQIADSLGYNNFVLESNSNIAYIGGTVEQQIQTLEKFYESYKKQIDGFTDEKYQDRLNAIGKILSDVTKKYQDASNIVKEYEEQQNFSEDVAFFEDENKNSSYKKLTNDLIELNQQFEQANSTASKLDLIDKINSVYDELQKLVAGNKIAKESVESLFDGFSSGINQYINSITSSADTYVSTFTDYTENGFKTATENIDTFKSALQSLNDDGYVSAETMWKLIEMDSSLSDSFVKVADGFRISSDKIIDSKDELIKKELEYAESEANTSKKILTNLKLRLQAIQKQKEIEKQYLQDNGANSAWDVNRLKQYDYEIKQIEDSISEVESTSKKWNLAISQIKSGLGDTVSITDKLKKQSEEIESNIDKIQDRIDSLNDDIEDLKDKQEELLKYQEYQIDKIVDKLEDEQKTLEDEKAALEEQLEILENQKSEIEEQIKIYEDIVSIVEDAINDEKSAIEKEKDLVQSEKEELQKQLDILEDKKASIEDSIQDYEKIYSLVSDIIDKETESIEKERDAVESYYDDMISKLQEENDERERSIELAEKEAALENAKRNKVRVYNEQKGWTWAEDTEAIKKAQDELDKFNNQIKIEDLEKEKEQKLKEFDDKISAIKEYGEQFTNGQQNYENNQTYLLAEKLLGMSREEIYEKIANQDADFVKQLNETYYKIQETRDGDIQSEIDYINQQIDEKDNQIEVYEEMIDEWDRYIEEWQNTVTEYKKNQDKLIAEQKIGSDWLEKVKKKDTDILKDFKNNYNSYQQALNGTITQEITDLKDSIQAKENEIESKKKQIEEWNTYKEELNQYVDDVSQTWSDYVTGLQNIVLDENSTYIDRCRNLTDFKDEYLRLTGEIIDKQGELSNATYELEAAKSRLEDLQNQIESSNNAYNEAVYNQIDSMSAEYRDLGSQWRYYEPMASSGDPVAAAKINAIASQMYALEVPLRELCEKVGVDFDSITQYATGGVNTSTGLAWLDGTPNKPELVLNNTDTSKLYNLLHTLSVDQLKQKFHFDTFSNPPKSLNAMANNTSAVNNNNNSQNIILNFYGNIETNSPADFMQQMNRYIQHNKLNGRINY